MKKLMVCFCTCVLMYIVYATNTTWTVFQAPNNTFYISQVSALFKLKNDQLQHCEQLSSMFNVIFKGCIKNTTGGFNYSKCSFSFLIDEKPCNLHLAETGVAELHSLNDNGVKQIIKDVKYNVITDGSNFMWLTLDIDLKQLSELLKYEAVSTHIKLKTNDTTLMLIFKSEKKHLISICENIVKTL